MAPGLTQTHTESLGNALSPQAGRPGPAKRRLLIRRCLRFLQCKVRRWQLQATRRSPSPSTASSPASPAAPCAQAGAQRDLRGAETPRPLRDSGHRLQGD